MSKWGSTLWLTEIRMGNIPGHSIIDKFGKNDDVGTSFEPASIGGIYNTPQPAAATTLRVKAGDVDDDAAGTGAREVTLMGLDETGVAVTEAIPTAGTSAGAASTTTWIRMPRSFVSSSGTYAGAGADSQAADIVIENGAGGTDWLTLHKPDLGRSQSQIGQYSVPLGVTAYVFDYVLTTNSNKEVDFLFFKRESLLDAAAPYQARKTMVEHVGIYGHFNHQFIGGKKFEELTDIGWMVKAAAAAIITVDFSIVLIDN